MSAETDLLPLPMPKGDVAEGGIDWTDDEMQAYARANVAHATDPLQAEIDALRTRLEDTVRDSTNKIEARAQGGGQVLGYVRRAAIQTLRVDDEVTGVMVHIDPPTDSVPVYLAPPSAPVGVENEPGAVRALVTAANAVLALYPHDDQLWTLESAVRPFNATRPAECSDGCPPQQVCDYCQIAALTQQPAAVDGLAARLVDELDGLVSESDGVSGLHLNGDVATWEELLPGGRFERLSSLDELREAIASAQQQGQAVDVELTRDAERVRPERLLRPITHEEP